MKNEIVEILKIGFLMEYYSINDLVKWADRIIEIETNPDENIIELSIAKYKSNNEILHCLNSINNKGEVNYKDIKQFYLGLYNNWITEEKKNWLKIEEEVLKFSDIYFLHLSEVEKLFFSKLSNDLSLREEGFESPMKMPDDLKKFLNSYNVSGDINNEFKKTGIVFVMGNVR